MTRIGIVDLDTSHGESFAKQIAAIDGAELVATLDHLDIRDDAYVDDYCGERGCKRCATAADMMEVGVDAVAVLSVNWDAHLDRAKPFLEAGVPVFIDKPMAGSAAGVAEFQALVEKTGTPFFEGSGWRWNATISKVREEFATKQIDCVMASAPNQYFYYGIHSAELALGLLGPGMESVQMVRHDEKGTLIHFVHSRGTRGYLQPQCGFPFRAASFVVDGEFHCAEFPIPEIHRSVVETLIATATKGEGPLPVHQTGESVKILAAAIQSHQTGGAPVKIDEVDPSISFDGAAFVEEYSKR